MKEYAVYRGEQMLAVGTLEDCAEVLGVKPKTVLYYATPTYQKRTKNKDKCLVTIRLDD